MKPGRELDALVAEKVMGWTNVRTMMYTENGPLLAHGVPPGERYDGDVPNYSTDIAAAFEVTRELRRRDLMLAAVYDFGEGHVSVHLTRGREGYYSRVGQDWADTICLAALEAVGVEL